MNFAFSEEQEELRGYARRWLTEKMPPARVRELMESEAGWDRADWSQVAEYGWQAMAIPEEFGGAGFGFLEQAVLLEEQGRSLFCGPFLSSVVLGASIIEEAASDAQRGEILAAIAAGETTIAVAIGDDGALAIDDLATAAAVDGDGWRLTGTKGYVMDGHTADLLLVGAQTADGVSIFLVDGDAPGVSRRALPSLDETRKLATVQLDGVRVEGAARLPGDAAAAAAVAAARGAVAIALENVGGAQATLDMAVQYAKDRQQFERPIGSFQAIKHKCADMLISVESARSAAYYAAWAVATGSDEARSVVPLAKAHTSDAFFSCAAENIQIHGGIGFTWEQDAHLWFKRARANAELLGSPAEHRSALADVLGF